MRISDWSSDVCSSDLEELDRLADSVLVPERYEASYATMFDGDRRWQDIRASGGDTFEWPNDNYMKEPPFFLEVGPELPATEDIVGARLLVLLADSITTDPISHGGKIGTAPWRERGGRSV